MRLAWFSAVVTAAFDIKLGLMGALAPEVMTTFEGFVGSDEDTEFLAKVHIPPSII